MTVYDIPNIEHCTVTPIGSAFRIVTDDGWYIHFDDGTEENQNVWKGAVVLLGTTDWTKVEIKAEADLPTDAEICGGDEPETETM